MSTSNFLALFAAVCGGAAVALQAPINAALSASLKSSIGATAVSFGVGFVILTLVLVVIGEGSAFGRLGSVNPWLLIGGLFGAFYVWTVVWTVPTLGVLAAISAVVLGQLSAALYLDAVGPFGLQAIQITWQRVLGVVMVAGGLWLSKL